MVVHKLAKKMSVERYMQVAKKYELSSSRKYNWYSPWS